MQALTREEVRALDRRATEEFGVPSLLLMENAGRACADAARRMVADDPRPVNVVCGPGNNGGDGLVVARTLHARGVPVEAWLAAPLETVERLSADVRANADMWRRQGRDLRELATPAQLEAARPELERASLLVDALFGTGLARPVEGHLAAVVELLDAAPAPVLAVDVPSGLDADTGEVLGVAPTAACTVTFVAPNVGLTRGECPRLAGAVEVAEIGIPRPLLDEQAARTHSAR